MLFSYKVLTKSGEEREGEIEAVNEDIAISSLQRRGLIVVFVQAKNKRSFFDLEVAFLSKVSQKEVVLLSRQISTLFEAQVSALKAFRLLASETENQKLQATLISVGDDIQGGMPISDALAKHPNVFSTFYVNMVRAGEESGKLSETFLYLADYLERTFEIISKTRSALIYPAFAISVFIIVMVLLMTTVVPKLGQIVSESGQVIPIYTKIVIGISNFMLNFWELLTVLLLLFVFLVWYYAKSGAISFSKIKLRIPYVGKLYTKLYLSRIADNMNTMLTSGIQMIRAIEITAAVVGNDVYRDILLEAADDVKTGNQFSGALSKHSEIPRIMVQIIKVGEETGGLAKILQKLSIFYKREVDVAVETLASLIEPVLIVLLGLGVGTVLAAVLLPIYNIAGSF